MSADNLGKIATDVLSCTVSIQSTNERLKDIRKKLKTSKDEMCKIMAIKGIDSAQKKYQGETYSISMYETLKSDPLNYKFLQQVFEAYNTEQQKPCIDSAALIEFIRKKRDLVKTKVVRLSVRNLSKAKKRKRSTNPDFSPSDLKSEDLADEKPALTKNGDNKEKTELDPGVDL